MTYVNVVNHAFRREVRRISFCGCGAPCMSFRPTVTGLVSPHCVCMFFDCGKSGNGGWISFHQLVTAKGPEVALDMAQNRGLPMRRMQNVSLEVIPSCKCPTDLSS